MTTIHETPMPTRYTCPEWCDMDADEHHNGNTVTEPNITHNHLRTVHGYYTGIGNTTDPDGNDVDNDTTTILSMVAN